MSFVTNTSIILMVVCGIFQLSHSINKLVKRSAVFRLLTTLIEQQEGHFISKVLCEYSKFRIKLNSSGCGAWTGIKRCPQVTLVVRLMMHIADILTSCIFSVRYTHPCRCMVILQQILYIFNKGIIYAAGLFFC